MTWPSALSLVIMIAPPYVAMMYQLRRIAESLERLEALLKLRGESGA